MFLHSYNPSPILLDLGFVSIYWYGLLITLGLIAGFFVFYKLTQRVSINKNQIFNLCFWSIIWGIIGGRLYHILSELPYYWQHPLEIFYIWNGGVGIFGSIIAGVLVVYYFTKKYRINSLHILDLAAPGLVLAQAIGRWGNYFNQELYGQPTDLPWAIPIAFANRLPGFENFTHFHPVFLYESLFCLILFMFLFLIHKRGNSTLVSLYKPGFIFLLYIFLYSIWRFLVEFLRIDYQPAWLSLRLGQWVSLGLILVIIIFYFVLKKWYNKNVLGIKY